MIPIELKKEKFTVQIKYSDEAVEKKLMKFITPNGDEFEISADEMISMLIGQVNQEVLDATFVEMDKINVVEVGRQIRVKLTEDLKSGQEININYKHPYPVEFALIEQAMGIAKINEDVPAFTLTKEYLDEVRKKITPKQENFIKKFYRSFKNLKFKN